MTVINQYTVKPGDTLSNIAKEYYGAGYQYRRIFAANGLMLSNPDMIYPGQVLRIPTLYKVQPGDTLSQIAKTYYGDGSLYPRIFDANLSVLKSPDLIYPGQELLIPELYKVQAGDTLSQIAGNYYGDPALYKQIFDANRSVLKNPDEIYPDQYLVMPDLYKVQSGDTLSKMAEKCYGDGGWFMKIFDANPSTLSDPNEIKPDQVLVIPPK